jgi:hypothetical protein
MKEAMAVVEDLVVNKDTMIAAKLAMLAVVSVTKFCSDPSNTQATWQKTAVKVKNVTTVVVWDMSVAIAIKLLKQKFATGMYRSNLVY